MRNWPARLARRVRGPARAIGVALLPSLPFVLLLALALGVTVWVGAELAHAYPSEKAPYGWSGPGSFNAGVATLRPHLVLAASLPGLVWGLHAARRLRPRETTPGQALRILGLDLPLVFIAAWGGALIGRLGAASTKFDAFWAFTGSHGLLAASFYALAVLSAVAIRSAPALLAGTAWTGFVAIYDPFLRWKTLREIGLPGLQAGLLPAWFYAAQALSPVSLYRALLIVWNPGFRDYEERAVLDGATLPGWMTTEILGSAHLFLWVLVPLELAWIVWTLGWSHDQKIRTHARGDDGTRSSAVRTWLRGRVMAKWDRRWIAHRAAPPASASVSASQPEPPAAEPSGSDDANRPVE